MIVTMRLMSDLVRNQDPLMLPPTATVLEATRQMRERNVGAVLITEQDRRLVGIFTGRDAVDRVLAEGKSAAKTLLVLMYIVRIRLPVSAGAARECSSDPCVLLGNMWAHRHHATSSLT